MKSYCRLLLLSALYAAKTIAQNPIVIQSGNLAFSAHQSSVIIFTNPQVLNPAEGADKIWDYSVLGPLYVSDTVEFIHTNYQGFSAVSLKQTPKKEWMNSFSYIFDEVLEKSLESYTRSGRIIPAQDYSIESVTGNVQDSILIPEQAFYYQEPYDEIMFPATFSSSWTSNYHYMVQMLSRVPTIGSYNATVELKVYVQRTSEILGWGKILCPTISGSQAEKNVLLLKVTEQKIDSVYVNGMPSNLATLVMFGINQGDVTMNYSYRFIDSDDLQPVAVFDYKSTNFQFCSKASFRMNELDYVSTEKNDYSPIKIFPNPTMGMIKIEISHNPNSTFEFSIFSETGRLVKKVRPDLELDLSNLSSGIYYYLLKGEQNETRGKLVILPH